MKKSFTILMTAALMLLSGLGWAQTRTEVTWTASEQGYTNGQEITDVTFDENVAATFAKGTNSNAPKYYTSGTAIRCYGGNYFTVSSDYDLTQIVITFGSSDGSNAITTDCGTYENGTWTGAANSVTFTIGGTSGNRRIAGFAITYSAEAPEVFAPTFNPAGGTYTEAQTVSISCETDGATIYYTTDGTAPDNNSTEYTGAITVSETMTIKAIAYVGTDASTVASATYTILTLMTIAEARAQGTGAVYTSGTVTSCVGTTGYIQDATAAICVFGTSLTIGDNISVQGSLTTYNGLLEITNPVVTVISSGNTVEPEVMTIAEINASTNQGWYVRIENATVTNIDGDNTTISQEGNSILVYKITGVELEVNDIVSLNGNIGNHNGIQIANPKDVTVQQSEEPAIIVDPATVDVPCAAAEGTLTVTYQNIDMDLGPEIYWYKSDGTTAAEYDWVTADFNENGNIDYIIDANTGDARLAYMKVYGLSTDGDDVYSELITFSQGHYVADFATLPFAFDGGRANIENTDGLTQEGLGSDYGSSPKLKFDGTGDWVILHFNEQPGTLTFDIKGNSFSGGTFTVQTSEDGETYTDLASYTELGNTQSEEFNNLNENVRYIKWIYTEKSSGNVALGNIALAKYVEPVLVPSITVTPELVEVDATEHEGTLGLAYENLEISDMNDFIVVYFDNQGGSIDDPDWIEVSVAEQDSQIGEGYVVSYNMEENVGEARTAYFKVYALDANANDVYSNIVTVNQAAYVAPAQSSTYTLASSIESGKTYIIVGVNGEDYAAMGKQNSNNRAAVSISVDGNTAAASIGEDDVHEFVVNFVETTDNKDYYSIYDNGYLYAASSSANHLKTESELSNNSKWTITFNSENGTANIVAERSNNRNVLQYNSGSSLFSCYASASQKPVYLYVKDDETPVTETHTLYINGYTSDETKDGYYLIASPVSVDPASVEGMTTGDFDLYYFDESKELEWINYEDQTNGGFNLVPGKGYLYAKKAIAETPTYTFELTGTPYSGNGEFPLSYTEDAVFAGWNLVGNPYAVAATPNKPYYRLNDAGSEVSASTESSAVNAMEGVFVVATEAGQTVSFSTTPSGKGESIALNVMKDRGTVIDRAIVRFGEGEQLPKFQLFENSTKLYIPQGNNDYAVVRSEAQGEMPVNFKAKENGTYTISVNTENIEMDYLHLIDNMTGTDVDLLQTPSYTFEATTRDYASRFRLVFSADENGASTGSATFAYFNGNEWVVSNEGDAQLHVIDMTGRIVSTETINGNATVKVNAAPGVYMLRLVNGNDIKTQKVIIK